MFYKKKIAVVVEGKKFNSIQEAGQYVGINPVTLAMALRTSKRRTCKGLSICYANETKEKSIIEKLTKQAKSQENVTRKLHRCPVECIATDGQRTQYISIRSAALAAKADEWTMGLKMHTAGKFIDRDGNVYKRLKPIFTNKVYNNTGATLQFDRQSKHTRTVKQVAEPTKENVVKVKSGVELAKSLLIEKTIDYIQHNNFEVAKQLLDVVKTIKE